MEKIKISPFEYALIQACDPKEVEKYEPFTEKEVREQREANIRRQLSRIKGFKGFKNTPTP